MRLFHGVLTAILGLLVAGCANTYTAPSPEITQILAPTGKLRVGLLLGSPASVIRNPASGEMRGVAFDLGQELARRMAVPFEPVVYPSIGDLLDGAKSGAWDVAMFGVNSARSKQFDFTQGLIEIEFGYLAPSGSFLSKLIDVDRPGIKVGVQAKSAVEAILTRSLKNAALVPGPGVQGGFDMLKSAKADVFAANKSILFEMADKLPGSRVLDGNYATESQAMATPKARDAGMAYMQKFVENAKSEGLVRAAVARAGLRGAIEAGAK